MKPLLICFISLIFIHENVKSQEKTIFYNSRIMDTSIHLKDSAITLNETTVVKDSTGSKIPYLLWSSFLNTGEYCLKADYPNDKLTEYTLFELCAEEIKKNKNKHLFITPSISRYLKIGQPFPSFSDKDIYGNRYNSKNLKGKIIVLYFCSLGSEPTQHEIPGLNEIVDSFKNNKDVIFLSVCMDKKWDIKDYTKVTPFYYNLIADGMQTAKFYDIRSFPTHVILDREGKVYFYTTGLSFSTIEWIKKSINELIEKG